ncbi:hypothetical protein [uncultured Mediterranean phage uvDeep-CGR2-KM19-C37]|nr:hypothetical protein [uncultured Mediterranean phage uvDeep-CGR2-KM19-C37]
MTAPQGVAHFPGIEVIRRANFTLSHGISPSVCMIETVPMRSFVPRVGTLSFTFGSTRINFPGCTVGFAAMDSSRDARLWTLQVLDRRWKWAYGRVSGVYNVRLSDGSLDPDTERTPQELAGLLLESMGESRANVAELPNFSRPFVDWDVNNPADELAGLCDGLGCRVVLGLDNRVSLRRVGVGRPLPVGGQEMHASFGFTSARRPDSIIFVGGPTRIQSKLALEAVGEETDGTAQLIDDLSYKPAEGWGTWFEPVSGVAQEHEYLTEKTIFRWYRVKEQAEGGLQIESEENIHVENIRQLFPLGSDLVETVNDGRRVRRPMAAYVEGVFWPEGEDLANTAAGTLYPTDDRGRQLFSIDSERGIVMFSDMVRTYDSTTLGYAPAELYLTTSYSLRDEDGVIVRLEVEQQMPGPRVGTGPLTIRRDEVSVTHRHLYSDSVRLVGRETNIDAARDEARRTLDAVESSFMTTESVDLQYAGIIPIDLDGAIQQVTWHVGPPAATTRASRGSEHEIDIPSYDQRRQQEGLARVIERFA